MTQRITGFLQRRGAALAQGALCTLLGLVAAPPPALAASTIPIAQYPLTVAIPAHPQVMLALGNSQSMDGDLSGAIWTGTGGLGLANVALTASSSPVNYTVPAGFTAPVTLTPAGSSAPYTVSTVLQYDNSASRLNVAKAGITSILNTFLADADFGLMDYQTSGNAEYTTWVYYMSQPGGFTFTNTQIAGTTYVTNPCYGVALTTITNVNADCKALNGRYANINTYQWMAIQDTSDEPSISDVLYAPSSFSPLFVEYNGPNPANPFTSYSLGQYNTGGVEACYNSTLPSQGGEFCETPTNAGYVPYSTEVMNAERGFGYYTTGETATPGTTTSWAPLVNMTSAGQVPTASTVAAAAAAFTSYLQPETSSTATAEIKAQATQSPIAGLLLASKDYFTARNPTSSNGCPPNRYVVLVTDGLPTLDLSNHTWPPLGSTAASPSPTGWNVTASFNGDGSLNTTNSQALTDTISTLNSMLTAGIKTYVIALGAGVANSSSVVGQTLTSMAVAGGSGAYYSAQSVAQLNSAMQQILAKILAETSATSASSVNSTGINTTSVAYQGKFNTSDTYQDWTGDLMAFPINSTTGVINTATSAALWSAQAQLDAQSYANPGRLIVTYDPTLGVGTPFEWSTGTSTSGIGPSSALGTALETFTADPSGQDMINYLRGSSAQEARNGGVFRNRSHKLADIVDSAPLYVAGPSGPWQQASYFSFQAAYRNREPIIYIGANDGMLHAFNAATGSEIFAYVPNGVWNNLTALANPLYNENHRFYVDGSPNAADMLFSDGTWHTVLMGAEAAGGNTIFAMDITNPSNFGTEATVAQQVLWEFSDINMGYGFSSPVAVDTAAGFAVMFGNGYDSLTQQPFLYAVNPKTGALMGKVNLCLQVPTACTAGVANGLSSITAVNTSGLLSTPSNIVYAGDLQGNMWRVNISNVNPALWTATVLFQARDGSGNAQPITVQPAVSLNPLAPALTGVMVFFGTGQFLAVSDLSNTNTQTVYGVYDNGLGAASPLTRASLVRQTMSAVSDTYMGTTYQLRTLSNNPVLLPSVSGWFVDLSLLAGERVVTDPTVFNGTVQLTTYQPNSNPCTSGGQSYYMVFSYATGGATTLPQFDWQGGSTVGNNDLLTGGGTVAGVSLGTSYAAQPKLVTGMGGARAFTTTGAAEGSGGAAPGTCNNIPNMTTCIPGWTNVDSRAKGAWLEVR